MYSDLAQRKVYECPITLCALIFASIVCTLVCSEESVPLVIRRRLTGDFAYTDLNSTIACGNETFVTDERQCVSNNDLLNGMKFLMIVYNGHALITCLKTQVKTHSLHSECEFAIAPNGSRMTQEISVFIRDQKGITLLAVFLNSKVYNAVITQREQSQQTRGSFSNCNIVSLEVYRGRHQAYKISHQGFSVTSQTSITVCIKAPLYQGAIIML